MVALCAHTQTRALFRLALVEEFLKNHVHFAILGLAQFSVCMNAYLCIYIRVCVYIYIYIYSIYIYICVCVCVCVCVYIYIYMCMCVCACLHINIPCGHTKTLACIPQAYINT
jgi:hypothetical protein